MGPNTRAMLAERQRLRMLFIAFALNLFVMPSVTNAYCLFNKGKRSVTFYQLPVGRSTFKVALRPGESMCCNWKECDCNGCNGRCGLTMFGYKYRYENVDAVTIRLIFEFILSIVLDVISIATMFIPGAQALGVALKGTSMAIRMASMAAKAAGALNKVGLGRAVNLVSKVKASTVIKTLRDVKKVGTIADKATKTLDQLLDEGYDGVVTTYNGGVVYYTRDYKGKMRVMGCWGGPCKDDDVNGDWTCGPRVVGSGADWNPNWAPFDSPLWNSVNNPKQPNGCPRQPSKCPAPICDNGICEKGETCRSCPQDCACIGPGVDIKQLQPPPPPPDGGSIVPYGLGYFASGCPYNIGANESFQNLSEKLQTQYTELGPYGLYNGAVALQWINGFLSDRTADVTKPLTEGLTVKLCGPDPLRLFCFPAYPSTFFGAEADTWPADLTFRKLYTLMNDTYTTNFGHTGFDPYDISMEELASKNSLFIETARPDDGTPMMIDEEESDSKWDKPFTQSGVNRITWCWPWTDNTKPNNFTEAAMMPVLNQTDYGKGGSCFWVAGQNQDLTDAMRLYQMSRQRLQALNPWLDPNSNKINAYGIMTCAYSD